PRRQLRSLTVTSPEAVIAVRGYLREFADVRRGREARRSREVVPGRSRHWPIVLPSYRPTVPPSHRPTVPPSCRPAVLPSCRPTVPPSHRPAVLPSCRPTVLLSYCPIVLPRS